MKTTLIFFEYIFLLAEYMDTSGAAEGHLVIFDKREKSWEEKIYTRQETLGNKVITVWGM